MPEKRQYLIRQAILNALADVYPGGKETAELLRAEKVADRHTTMSELESETAMLLAGGYIKDLRPHREAWWKITHSGLMQIREESVLDEVVWGTKAL